MYKLKLLVVQTNCTEKSSGLNNVVYELSVWPGWREQCPTEHRAIVKALYSNINPLYAPWRHFSKERGSSLCVRYDQRRSKWVDRVDNVQGPWRPRAPKVQGLRRSRGHEGTGSLNQKEPIGLGAPHWSLSMGPRESCYACGCDICD